MNILPGALLLVLLLLPGFIFRMGYLAKPFASNSFNSSFVEELLFSLLPAFVLQVSGYLIANRLVGVNEKTFLLLLINSDKVITNPITSYDIGLFALYLIIISLIALGLGFTLREFAIRTKLHLKYKAFRIYNEWQIYFDGFILDYPDEPGERNDVKAMWLDVLVENKDGAFIYSGYLNQYVLAKDETLSRIYLTAVRRRKLADDTTETFVSPELSDRNEQASEVNYNDVEDSNNKDLEAQLDKRYYFMPGDYFMLPGSEIKSVNITYYTAKATSVG